MNGTWDFIKLGPDARNPEAHWLHTVLEERGPRPCTVKVSQAAAIALAHHYGSRFEAVPAALENDGSDSASGAALEKIASQIIIGQETFDALSRFAKAAATTDTIEVDLLATSDGVRELLTIGAEDELVLSDIGIGLPNEAYTKGEVRISGDTTCKHETTTLDGDEVIVAVIDDGIGFANERFRLSNKISRVEYFWDMRVPPKESDTPGCSNGRLLRKSEIDELLDKYHADEKEIYRCCGMIDPRAERRQPLKYAVTHGTHILDLAAGFDFREDKDLQRAKKRPIIAVQMPSEVVAERSDAFTSAWLRIALNKIRHLSMELAHRIAHKNGTELKCLPIVVNFSFGTLAGPHDGESPVELAIRDFIAGYRSLPGNPQCEFVIPAGNGHLSRTIAQIKVPPRGKIEALPWRVQPDDKTSSYVQIWLPNCSAGKQQVSVSLHPPNGGPVVSKRTKLDHALEWRIDGEVYARLYHQNVARADGRFRERILIAIRGTASDNGEPVCPSGVWKIDIRPEILQPGETIDVRIRRDDSLFGQRQTGRQSYFDHSQYVRFEPESGRIRTDVSREKGPVTRLGTLNGYAAGKLPLVVGGYRRSDGIPATYSGSGPTTSGKVGPVLAAICEESPSHSGVIASGTYSGSTGVLNGTSVAAPAVARVLSHIIASGGTRQDFEQSIVDTERVGIEGPRGLYPPIEPRRQGIGRYFTDKRSRYRRRIDQ